MQLQWIATALFVQSLAGQVPAPGTNSDQSQKLATVSGKTVSNSGQALKKTKVSLRPMVAAAVATTMPDPYVAMSDVEGKFVFEAVEPGRYTLIAERPGYQSMTYGARQPGTPGTVLTLTSGQSMAALNVTLSPQIVLSGKVLDADGDPAGQIQVRALRMMFINGKRQPNWAGNANTDENGEYKMQNLNPGKYYLVAMPPRSQLFGPTARSAAAPPAAGRPLKPEEDLVQTYYPGVADISSAQQIELTSGHDLPGTNITLRKSPVFHLRGKVAGSIPGDKNFIRVTINPRSGVMFDFMGNGSAVLGKDGSFDVASVAPGAYSLMLVNANGMFKVFATLPVTVTDRNVDDLVLTPEAPFEVTGQVITDTAPEKPEPAKQAGGAAPAAGAPVSVAGAPTRLFFRPVDGPIINPPRAVVADDGSFTVSDLTSGRFQVGAYGGAPGTYVKSIRYGDQDVLASNWLPSPGATSLQIHFAAGAAKVEGVAQGADGKPSSGVSVTLIPDPQVPDRSDLYKQGTTDQNGTFHLSGVPPGKYRAYAWDHLEFGNQFDPGFMKAYEGKGIAVEIAPSDTKQLTLKVIP